MRETQPGKTAVGPGSVWRVASSGEVVYIAPEPTLWGGGGVQRNTGALILCRLQS
jgi:hypothetical protein